MRTVQRLLLTHALFYVTPGILQLFMGDEYFSSLPFGESPETLDREQAGSFHDGQWESRGAKNGFFEFTRTMLSLRKEFMVGERAE